MRTTFRQVHPTVLLIIGIAMICAGVWLAFGIGKPILDNAEASSHWPGITGTIQTSRVVESRGSKGRKKYSAEVQYAYTVANRSYSGNTVWFGDNCKSSSACEARTTVQRYRPGSRVTVFYNPDCPEVAVLQPGVSQSSYVLYSMGWVIMVLGCALNFASVMKHGVSQAVPSEQPAGALAP